MNTDSKIRDGVLAGLSGQQLVYRRVSVLCGHSAGQPFRTEPASSSTLPPDAPYRAHRKLFWAVTRFVRRTNIQASRKSTIASATGVTSSPEPAPSLLRAVVRPQAILREGKRAGTNIMDVHWRHLGYIISVPRDRIYRFLQDLAPSHGCISSPDNREEP